jgi:peptidoglycan/LPS O-acetylase OafA/YrhL
MSTQVRIPGHFTALDGWRGICAILVAIYHFHTTSHLSQSGIVRNSYLFVDFFFVLSGFVITYAYIDRLSTLRDAGLMLWRRLGRLWPLHVAVLLGFILLELAVPALSMLLGVKRSASAAFDPATSATLWGIPTNLLLIHGLGLHDRLTWNHPSWSISTELWTYVIFALTVVLLRRRTVIAAGLLVAASLLILSAFSTRYIGVDYDLGIFRCIAGFFVGHLVFRLVRAVPVSLPQPTLVEVIGLAAMVLFVVGAGHTALEYLAPFVFGVIVWIFALERGAVSYVLKSRALAALGLVSYSIYMVHSLVIAVAHRGVSVIEQIGGVKISQVVEYAGERTMVISFGTAWTMDALVLLYVAVVIAISMVTWRYIEMPAQRWWNGASAAPIPAAVEPVTVEEEHHPSRRDRLRDSPAG